MTSYDEHFFFNFFFLFLFLFYFYFIFILLFFSFFYFTVLLTDFSTSEIALEKDVKKVLWTFEDAEIFKKIIDTECGTKLIHLRL